MKTDSKEFAFYTGLKPDIPTVYTSSDHLTARVSCWTHDVAASSNLINLKKK